MATLESDEVRDEVGARIGGRLVAERPELSPGEPMIEDAVAGVVTSQAAFHAAFRDGAVDLHRALLEREEASMTVAGSGAMLARSCGGACPERCRGSTTCRCSGSGAAARRAR